MASRPMLAAALGLCCGIALAHFLFGLPLWWIIALPCAGAVAAALAWRFRRRAALSLAAFFLCTTAGAALYPLAAPEVPEPPYERCDLYGTVAAVDNIDGGAADYDLDGAVLHYPDGARLALQGRVRLRGAVLPALAMPGQRVAAADVRVQRPAGPRNPGGFNGRMYGMTQGYAYIAYGGDIVSASGEERYLAATLLRARVAALDAIDTLWPLPEENAIIRGLLMGDTSRMGEEESEAFSRLGIAHVLAVSGLHVGFVVLLLQGILRVIFLAVPRRYAYLWGKLRLLRALLMLIGVFLYAALTGFSPSTTRALIMSAVVLGAGVAVVKADGLSSLSAAVLLILLLRPMDLFSASFQMSVGAVAGILLWSPWLEQKLQGLRAPRYLATSLSVSISAQIGILPLLARNYNRVPLLGLLANLFAVPLSAAVTTVGLPVLGLFFLFPSVAHVAAYPVGLLARLLLRLAVATAKYPLISVEMASPPLAMMACFWLFAWLISPLGRGLARRWWRVLCTAFSVGSILALTLWTFSLYPIRPVLTMLDVGQGHGSILRHGAAAILVDGGKSTAALTAARYYGLRYDAAFLTHGDQDHSGILAELILQEKVERLYVPVGIEEEKLEIAMVFHAARAKGVPIVYLRQGDGVQVGPFEVSVRAPLAWRQETGENANMLVLCVNEDVLFTGDLNMASESGVPLPRARILQVAHHGANGATSQELLSIVRPRVALIPVGTNSYGHPGGELLARLDDAGAWTERTDIAGAIQITLDDELRIERWARER